MSYYGQKRERSACGGFVYREYDWGNNCGWQPTIEKFIRVWQESRSVEDVREKLQSDLWNSVKIGATLIPEEDLLRKRAKSWRERGVPLKNLPRTRELAETPQERVERLKVLAEQIEKSCK